MEKSLNKIRMTLEALRDAMQYPFARIEGLTFTECGFKSSNTPPDGAYAPLGRLAGPDRHYWIKGSFSVNENESDFDYYLSVDPQCRGWDAKQPQCIVYLNGYMAQGIDVNHQLIPIEGGRDYELYNYIFTADGKDVDIAHRVVKIHRECEALYYDMLVPYDTLKNVYLKDSIDFATGLRVLIQCADMIDLRAPGSEAFFASVSAAREFIQKEYYGALCSTEGKPTVNCVGHTHIDVEWLWDRSVTKDKIQASASTVTSLMKRYPEYRFMLSQPELYRYLAEGSPEKMDEVKALAKDGRWEPEGAMFVECDCNLVSGESLVRQILYGKKYFKEQFGTDCRVLFLPDVFGYSAALPQILKKSGVDYFITSKISWNDTNTMPYDNFMWRGIDGTEIFSSFITGQSLRMGEKPRRTATYVGNNNPDFIYGTFSRQSQKAHISTSLNTYGYGDGGGGPTKDMLERLRRLMRGLPGLPVAISKPIADYMADCEREFLENSGRIGYTPRWVGELYLEFHRGTYTTAAANKRDNRRSELGLTACEGISALDLLHGGCYEKKTFDELWLTVLHDQFHDILPGSSIEDVYRNTAKDYKVVLSEIGRIKAQKLAAIAERIKTEGGMLVYNPLGFARRAMLEIDGKCYETDEEIPALGYKVIKPTEHTGTPTAEGLMLENALYRVEFDTLGNIVSLYDKRAEREVASGRLAEVAFYEDRPHEYDAWELESYHATKAYKLDAASYKTVYDGDRTGIEFTSAYMSSTVRKTVWLYRTSARIDIDMQVDWNERHQIMKLLFPVAVSSERASFEIQYGHTSRPTHRNTSWDAARFEVVAHKWMDISENGYGVAIMNDSKYGHSVDGNTVSVSCLRGPTYPHPKQDIGEHRFTLSVIPHEGTLYDANVIREGYMLNQPVLYMPVGKTEGYMPESYSLINTSNKGVIIEGAKLAEDESGIAVRLYESFGGRSKCKFTLGEPFSRAYLCDLTEKPVRELEIKDGTIELPLTPFAIETLKLIK